MTATRATVVRLPRRSASASAGGPVGLLGAGLAAASGASALADGLYGQRAGLIAGLVLLGLLVAATLAAGVPPAGPARLLLGGLVLLLAWTTLSMTWADSVERAWREVDRLVLYVAALGIAAAATRSLADARRVVGALALVTGVLAAVTAVRLAAGATGGFVEGRLDTPLGYVNGAAGLFAMGLWPAIAVAVGHRARPCIAAAALAAAALAGGLLVLTQSRAVPAAVLGSAVVVVALVRQRVAHVAALAVVAAAVAAALPWTLAVYGARPSGAPPADAVTRAGLAALTAALAAGLAWRGLLALRRRPGVRRAAPLLAVLAVSVPAAAGLAAAGDPVSAITARWHEFTALRPDAGPAAARFGEAGGFRYDLWRVALDEWRADPWRGVGAGNYAAGYFERRRTLEAVRQPHSLELQLLAETGVPGLALFAVVVGAAGWGLLRLARSRLPDASFVVAGAGGLAVAWLVHTSMDWLHLLPGLSGMTAVAGAALCVPARAEPGPPAGARAGRVAVAAVLLFAALAAAALGRHLAAVVEADRAAGAVATAPREALAAAAAAIRLDPAGVDAYVSRAAAYARLGEAGRADAALRDAVAREPGNHVLYALRGDLAVRRGRIADARRFYRAALQRNPRDPGLAQLARDPRAAIP